MKKTKLFSYVLFISLACFVLIYIFAYGKYSSYADDSDITAPTFNFTNAPQGVLSPGNITYNFSATDDLTNIKMFDYTIDEAAPSLVRKFYIDNVLAGTGNPGNNLNMATTNFAIGDTNFGERFVGLIDEVRVYNRYLNPTEIAQLYNYPDNVSNPVPNGGLVGYWAMDEASYNGTSGEVTDSSPIGADGTAVGTATTAPGRLGNALFLDEWGNSYVNLVTDNLSLPSGASSYTISAWIKPDYMGSRGIVGWGNYGVDLTVNAFRLNSGGLTNYWWGNDVDVAAPGFDLTGAWHHVVVTYGPDKIALPPIDASFNELTEEGTLTLSSDDYNDAENHTVKFYALDAQGNLQNQSYTFSVAGDIVAPVFDFSVADVGSITADTATFTFNITDESEVLTAAEFEMNNEGRASLTPLDGTLDEISEDFTITFDRSGFVRYQTYTVSFYAKDSDDNEASESFDFSFDEDADAPVISFDGTPNGLKPGIFTYSGSITDLDENVAYLAFQLDNNSRIGLEPVDGTFDELIEDFEYEVLTDPSHLNFEGAHTIKFYVRDAIDNERAYSFDVDVDRISPTCTSTWVNKPTPHYSNSATYSNITCTDERDHLSDAVFGVYHNVIGTIVTDTHITPLDGIFDESSETFSFSFTLPADEDLDGPVAVGFIVYDLAGNPSFDSDPVVIEYFDDSNPTIRLDQITPDPITDITPKITGSCVDNTDFDTNTFIKLIEYKLDNDDWSDLEPLDAPYNDSYSEIFSVELPEQELGSHTLTIRCTDGVDKFSTDSDTFEIIDIDESAAPGSFEHTDTFLSHTFQDIPNTTLVWGNDRLRLKEDLTFTRTLLDSSNYPGRYDDPRSAFVVVEDPDDSNILWYTKSNKIYKYFINSNSTEAIDMNAMFGFGNFEEMHSFEITKYAGDRIMWISDNYNLTVYNMTDDQLVQIAINEGAYSVDPDTSRGRLAAYLITGDAPGGFTNFIYYDLNGSITNTADDIISRPAIGGVFDSASAFAIWRDKLSNNVYVTFQNGGKIHKFNDNNTPSNFADDGTILTYSGYNAISSFTLDPDGKLIFGLANNANAEVFVVTDDGGTEYIPGDDTITRIATPRQLSFRNIFGIQYLEGENNVGDQLIFSTENNDSIYMNFNNTYTDLLDDTFIDLAFRDGVRPGSVFTYIRDYNTLYANIDTQGLYKIDLHRGWMDSGIAIGVPERPSQKLILDNFIADAEQGNNITANALREPTFLENLNDFLFPKVKAGENGVAYYISNDDGLTWVEVSLGQLENLNPNDYRIKFKIEMTEISGQSPALDSYSLNFAGYTTPSQAQTAVSLSALVFPTSAFTNSNFNLKVSALDALGYQIADYNSVVTLQLINSSGNVVSGLNVSAIDLVNGVNTLTSTQISQPGQYKIRATQGLLTTDSNQITISKVSANTTISATTTPIPIINFEANKYKITKGQQVTLSWSSAYLDTLILTPDKGAVGTTGTYTLSLDNTTVFVLRGTGQYGDLTSTLTVEVVEGPAVALSLEVSKDLNIIRGDRVTISWKALGADSVYIDYLGEIVSADGSFDLYPQEDMEITIIAKQGSEEIRKTIKIKVSEPSVLTSAVSNLPAAGIVLIALANVALFFSLLFNILTSGPARITLDTILNILRILGVIPYKKRRGLVYQTRTSKPVIFAVLNLMMADNKERIVTSIVSDLDGIYYEPFLSKGNYMITAKHEDNHFPTLHPRPTQLTTFDFYKGENLSIPSNKVQQAVIIPMDKVKSSTDHVFINWRKISMLLSRVLVWLQWTVYPMFILSVIFLVTAPSIFNLIICAIYSILIGYKLTYFLKRPSLTGKIYNRSTGRGISGAIIQLRANNQLVGLEKTDANGNYKFYVPINKYSVHLSRDEFTTGEGFGEQLIIDLNKESPGTLNIGMDKLE